MLTAERLHQLLAYDPETGVFTWLVAKNRRIKIGAVAGHLRDGAYRQIKIDGRRYEAHRLAFLYMTGAWPKGQVNHINSDKVDNRFVNLREATRPQNKANRRSAGGFKGVYWHKRDRRWQVLITVAGTRRHLGYFDTAEAAHAAYCAAAIKHSGNFARTS